MTWMQSQIGSEMQRRDLEREPERDVEVEELGKLRSVGRRFASRSVGVSTRSNRRFLGVDVILLLASALIKQYGGLARQPLGMTLCFLLPCRIASKGRRPVSYILAPGRLSDALLGFCVAFACRGVS